MTPIPPAELHHLRNQLPIDHVIANALGLPCKHREGFFRFLCPCCNEFNTATNPKTNLARCFRCQKNFNTIDIVILVRRCSFLHAVQFLRSAQSSM